VWHLLQREGDILHAVVLVPDCFYLGAGGILRPGRGGWRPAACVSSILADQLGWAAITGWALDLLRTALNVLKGNTIICVVHRISSAELVFGQPLSLPGGFVDAAEPPAVVFPKMRVSKVPPPPTRPLSYAQVVSRPAPGLEEVSFVYVLP
jgi:hypothetical protein